MEDVCLNKRCLYWTPEPCPDSCWCYSFVSSGDVQMAVANGGSEGLPITFTRQEAAAALIADFSPIADLESRDDCE